MLENSFALRAPNRLLSVVLRPCLTVFLRVRDCSLFLNASDLRFCLNSHLAGYLSLFGFPACCSWPVNVSWQDAEAFSPITRGVESIQVSLKPTILQEKKISDRILIDQSRRLPLTAEKNTASKVSALIK